jgi:hypothetical protein
MTSHNLGLFERAGERETGDRGRYNSSFWAMIAFT